MSDEACQDGGRRAGAGALKTTPMNRHERRAQARARRTAAGKLKLRCMACDRVGRPMSKEHIWPQWLIKRAGAETEPVRWANGKLISPSKAMLPLCVECNNAFGIQLEAPVSLIMDDLESGKGINDVEAELLVRWLWKFEGLFWSAANFTNPALRYSAMWTMKERVLGPSMERIRPALVLALATIQNNDEGFTGWPVGIDSGIGTYNSIFVSGVFCRTAIMVLMNQFSYLVPSAFGTYQLAAKPDESGSKVFIPPVGFATVRDAIATTISASGPLAEAHEAMVNDGPSLVGIAPNRVEIP